MTKQKNNSECSCIQDSFPMLSALFLTAASIAYFVFKKQSDKRYLEKWKDYEECGI